MFQSIYYFIFCKNIEPEKKQKEDDTPMTCIVCNSRIYNDHKCTLRQRNSIRIKNSV